MTLREPNIDPAGLAKLGIPALVIAGSDWGNPSRCSLLSGADKAPVREGRAPAPQGEPKAARTQEGDQKL